MPFDGAAQVLASGARSTRSAQPVSTAAATLKSILPLNQTPFLLRTTMPTGAVSCKANGADRYVCRASSKR